MEPLSPEFPDRLLALIARATSLRKDKVCSREELVAQQHLITAAMIGYTLWRVRMPTEQPKPSMLEKGFVYDYITANSIVRSLYETYVKMHYLCVDPVPPDVREFRIWVWERHGWETARRLAGIMGDPTGPLDKAIAELTAKIDASPHKPLLRSKEPGAGTALKNHGILRSLKAAAISAGIKERNWDFLYSLKSQFTHAGAFHIAKQTEMLRKGGRPATNAGEEVGAAVLRACPVLAAFLRAYVVLVPEAGALMKDPRDLKVYRLGIDVFDNAEIK